MNVCLHGISYGHRCVWCNPQYPEKLTATTPYEKIIERLEALEKAHEKIWEYCQSVMGDCVQQVEDLQKERNLGVERIKKLEQHHNYQIDQNRKISRRIDELEANNSEHAQKLIDQQAIKLANNNFVKSTVQKKEGKAGDVLMFDEKTQEYVWRKSEKKEGLTFVEAMTKVFEGKKIRLPEEGNEYCISIETLQDRGHTFSLMYRAMLRNDWMVLDD